MLNFLKFIASILLFSVHNIEAAGIKMHSSVGNRAEIIMGDVSIINSATNILTITAPTVTLTGAVSAASVAATGAVTAATVSAASVAATGAVTAATVSAASVAATGAVTAATVTASGVISSGGVAITGSRFKEVVASVSPLAAVNDWTDDVAVPGLTHSFTAVADKLYTISVSTSVRSIYPPALQIKTSGTCTDIGSGWAKITNTVDCDAARTALGLPNGNYPTSQGWSGTWMTYGCNQHTYRGTLQMDWNSNSGSSQPCGNNGRDCICQKTQISTSAKDITTKLYNNGVLLRVIRSQAVSNTDTRGTCRAHIHLSWTGILTGSVVLTVKNHVTWASRPATWAYDDVPVMTIVEHPYAGTL